MASPVLPKGEQNFIRFVKICLDVLKLPLVDILASEIQPADLYNKIQFSCLLLNGKNKLDSMQLKICFLSPPAIPDYNNFDVTLLYKLIRNLCSTLEPTKGWGKDPVDADIQIGDDIERLRLFRNNNVHPGSSEISDIDFEIIWKKLKSVLQRLQNQMTSKGYNVNYEEKMANIKQLDLGDELLDKYKIGYILEYTLDSLKQADDKEEPKISIEGPTYVVCGNTAIFIAVTTPENLKGWSVTWQKLLKWTKIHINSSTEKYYGSTEKNLVIQSVCKEDEGEYQAILSRDSKAKNISVSSNVIFLHATGGLPIFEVWNVTTVMEDIKIHYAVKKCPPYVNEIKWIKDGVPILSRNEKYNGGELNDRYFTITSPTIEDRGNYSCVVKNAVGSVQKDVRFDVPNTEISTQQQVYFGSKTSFTSRIVSCPSPNGVEWQQSNDGETFKSINISQPKYYGSSCNPMSPLLIIPKVTFEDKLYYRLLVWNTIGKQSSNTVFLDVKGSLPNITISHRTCVSNRSVTLIGNVFLYGLLPAVENVFWTKNGEKLDTQGSGGRYTEVTVDNPSLTIFEVNEYDAGSYQLTATNAVGSTTSDFLILDVPDVFMVRPEQQKNGRFWFTVTIQSIPAPDFAQWSIKENSSGTSIPIDENLEEFKGTSNTLPHPVLVVNPKIDLKNYCFQIEVRNFIGSCKKFTPGDESFDDSCTNRNQDGCLSELYLDAGAGLKFAKLFDDIAEHFPETKLRRLKDFIRYSHKVKDLTLFAQMVSARDCLEILCDHKLFTPWDVIFIQFLLKNTECRELFEKCVAYAEAHEALCFYEKVPENGFKTVQFHVRGNLSCYTPVEIRKIQQTVAAIVGCNSTEIFVAGYRHSSSFLAVLSIEKKHVKKLMTVKQQEKDKLSRLNIDYFIVDFFTIYIQSPKEKSGEDNNDDYPIMLRKLWKISDCREKQSHLFLPAKRYVLPKGKSAHERALFKKHSIELDSDIPRIYNAVQTASISVSAKEVKHISCLMPNRFWVSDMKKIQEIDKNGCILRELDIYFTLFGSHTLTKSGDLLFLKDNDVYMLTSNGEISNLSIHVSVHFCIHSSIINGDILIGDINIVTRYNALGMKLNQIEMDDKGQSLYVETIFITENTNGDIIVSDNGNKAVVATDKSGRHLFNYKGHHSQTTFHPGGICTDELGHILVCNVSSDQNVHLLDQKGQFLAYLLTKHQHGLDCPQALCVDSQHNLYVGYSNKNRINVYSYLAKEMIHEYYAKKSEAGVKLDSTELLYKRREPTEIKIDRLFEKLSDQINQPTKAQTDSKEESEFTATSFQTVTHSAKTQQTRKGFGLKTLASMEELNNHYTVRQCSKCQENTEYFCESCSIELCPKCEECHLHVNDPKTIEHRAVIYRAYREKVNCISKQQEIFYTRHNNVIGECCKPCDQIRKTINIIKTKVIFHRLALLAEIKSDVKHCKNLFSLFQSDTLKKSQKLKNQVELYLRDFEIKHICLKQRIKKNLHTIQGYELSYEQSAMRPVQFLLSSNKTRFNKLEDIHHPRQLSLLFMSESPRKKALIDRLTEIQFKEGGKRCLQNDRLLNLTFKITDADVCNHISCVSSDKAWVSDFKNNLFLINSIGKSMHQLKDFERKYFLLGFHTVGCERDLFFIDKDFNIIKWSHDINATTIFIHKPDKKSSWRPVCVNWSASTEKLLVGMHNKYTMTGNVTWYDRTGTLTQTIEQGLYKKPCFIIQNNNKDVVVSDNGSPCAVVVTEHGGRHRFSYRGRLSGLHFLPRGICADALCNILICDEDTHTVQMIDMNGQFLLHFLIRPPGILAPYSLTYNRHTHCLWVGSMNNSRVCVYRFINHLDDLTEKGTPQKKEHRQTKHEKYVSTFELHLSFKLKNVRYCHHVSYVTSKLVWVSNDRKNLMLTNLDGEAEENLRDVYSGYYIGYGLHTVNREKELFYIDKNHNIWKKSFAQNTTSYVFIENTDPEWRPQCVYCSLITGDLLVGMYHDHTSTGNVTRYNNSGQLILTVQHDIKGLEIYRFPNFVIENNNGDVVVSDLNAVVVTNRGGKYLFTYTGHPPGSGLKPRGICTDTNSHILVCNRRTNSIEIIDKEGQFLTHLLEDRVNIPHSLSYDDNNHYLWVGYENTNKMCVYRYNIQKAALDDEHSCHSAEKTSS